jgi:hypothetical protein
MLGLLKKEAKSLSLLLSLTQFLFHSFPLSFFRHKSLSLVRIRSVQCVDFDFDLSDSTLEQASRNDGKS